MKQKYKMSTNQQMTLTQNCDNFLLLSHFGKAKNSQVFIIENINRPINRQTNLLFNQQTGQSINQSINQLFQQLINQPFEQSTYQSCLKLTSGLIQ